MAQTPINGKIYRMWGGIVDSKDQFIGGRLIDHDSESETIITDLSLSPMGTDGAIFEMAGKDFNCSVNVAFAGVGALDGGGGLGIHSQGGMSFSIIRK